MNLNGYIVVIKRDGDVGTKFPLTALSCTIGRSIDCDIRIYRPDVSRFQCRIDVDPRSGKAEVCNLSETTPVFLNREPIQKAEFKLLCHKDELVIADRCFRWEYPDDGEMYIIKSCVANEDLKGMSACSSNTPLLMEVNSTPQELWSSLNKKVSFGPYLSPEQFDDLLPPSTPIQKGQRPHCDGSYSHLSVVGDDMAKPSPFKSLLRCNEPSPIKPYLVRNMKMNSSATFLKISNDLIFGTANSVARAEKDELLSSQTATGTHDMSAEEIHEADSVKVLKKKQTQARPKSASLDTRKTSGLESKSLSGKATLTSRSKKETPMRVKFSGRSKSLSPEKSKLQSSRSIKKNIKNSLSPVKSKLSSSVKSVPPRTKRTPLREKLETIPKKRSVSSKSESTTSFLLNSKSLSPATKSLPGRPKLKAKSLSPATKRMPGRPKLKAKSLSSATKRLPGRPKLKAKSLSPATKRLPGRPKLKAKSLSPATKKLPGRPKLKAMSLSPATKRICVIPKLVSSTAKKAHGKRAYKSVSPYGKKISMDKLCFPARKKASVEAEYTSLVTKITLPRANSVSPAVQHKSVKVKPFSSNKQSPHKTELVFPALEGVNYDVRSPNGSTRSTLLDEERYKTQTSKAGRNTKVGGPTPKKKYSSSLTPLRMSLRKQQHKSWADIFKEGLMTKGLVSQHPSLANKASQLPKKKAMHRSIRGIHSVPVAATHHFNFGIHSTGHALSPDPIYIYGKGSRWKSKGSCINQFQEKFLSPTDSEHNKSNVSSDDGHNTGNSQSSSVGRSKKSVETDVSISKDGPLEAGGSLSYSKSRSSSTRSDANSFASDSSPFYRTASFTSGQSSVQTGSITNFDFDSVETPEVTVGNFVSPLVPGSAKCSPSIMMRMKHSQFSPKVLSNHSLGDDLLPSMPNISKNSSPNASESKSSKRHSKLSDNISSVDIDSSTAADLDKQECMPVMLSQQNVNIKSPRSFSTPISAAGLQKPSRKRVLQNHDSSTATKSAKHSRTSSVSSENFSHVPSDSIETFRSSLTSRKPSESRKGFRRTVTGSAIKDIKRLVRTPKSRGLENNDYGDVIGIKRLLVSPKQRYSLNDSLIKSLKRVLQTPLNRNNNNSDYSELVGLRELFASPKKSFTDDSPIEYLRYLVKSPRSDLPVNGLEYLKVLFESPEKDDTYDESVLQNLKQLFKIPRNNVANNSDCSDVNVKRLLLSSKEPAGVDDSVLECLQEIMRTPGKTLKRPLSINREETSPRRYESLSKPVLESICHLMETQEIEDDLSVSSNAGNVLKVMGKEAQGSITGVPNEKDIDDAVLRCLRHLLRTPKSKVPSNSDYKDVLGVKNLLQSPKQRKETGSDETENSLKDLRKLFQSTGLNDLTDVEYLESLFELHNTISQYVASSKPELIHNQQQEVKFSSNLSEQANGSCQRYAETEFLRSPTQGNVQVEPQRILRSHTKRVQNLKNTPASSVKYETRCNAKVVPESGETPSSRQGSSKKGATRTRAGSDELQVHLESGNLSGLSVGREFTPGKQKRLKRNLAASINEVLCDEPSSLSKRRQDTSAEAAAKIARVDAASELMHSDVSEADDGTHSEVNSTLSDKPPSKRTISPKVEADTNEPPVIQHQYGRGRKDASCKVQINMCSEEKLGLIKNSGSKRGRKPKEESHTRKLSPLSNKPLKNSEKHSSPEGNKIVSSPESPAMLARLRGRRTKSDKEAALLVLSLDKVEPAPVKRGRPRKVKNTTIIESDLLSPNTVEYGLQSSSSSAHKIMDTIVEAENNNTLTSTPAKQSRRRKANSNLETDALSVSPSIGKETVKRPRNTCSQTKSAVSAASSPKQRRPCSRKVGTSMNATILSPVTVEELPPATRNTRKYKCDGGEYVALGSEVNNNQRSVPIRQSSRIRSSRMKHKIEEVQPLGLESSAETPARKTRGRKKS